MSTWDEPDFSPPFAPSAERIVPRFPTLAEQRAKIAERCRIRDKWKPTIIRDGGYYEKDSQGRLWRIAP